MTFKKNTKQRKIILDILSNSDYPINAEQIYEKASNIYKSIAKTTIYRNIDSLLKDGTIVRYNLNNNMYSYMLNSKHEHFIKCKNCGKVVSIENCPLHELEKKLSKETGFNITDHSIEFYGYCKDCKKAKEN